MCRCSGSRKEQGVYEPGEGECSRVMEAAAMQTTGGLDKKLGERAG